MATACIAIDLGAESGRVLLARRAPARALEASIVYRFRNHPVEREGGLYWDLAYLEREIERGVDAAAAQASEGIASLGVDGWAVDYIWLDAAGCVLAPPRCYRDPRTESAMPQLWRQIPDARLYALTGVQSLRFNTLYQLYADRRDHLALPEGAGWLNLPEYFLHHMGAPAVSEYTMATHTQMLDGRRRAWSEEIFTAAGLKLAAAPRLAEPGTLLGPLAERWRRRWPALAAAQLIAPACHDTASAIAATGADALDTAFLISGTWSLIGCVLSEPCLADAARAAGFTNQGGIGGSIYFLKNVNGLWLLEECRRAWSAAGRAWPLEELIAAAGEHGQGAPIFPVNAPELLLPGNMPERINRELSRAGHAPLPLSPAAAPRMTASIFASLADAYARSLEQASALTGRRFTRLVVAGGGSRNHLLNAWIAERTGLQIEHGPAEASLAGNAALQFAALERDALRRAGQTSWSSPALAELAGEISAALESKTAGRGA